jgi:hypothetical protein
MEYDILDDSPEAYEEHKKQQQAYQQDALDYNNAITRLFSSDDGKKVMELWLKRHVFSPTVIAGNSREENGIREGKASFVRDIFDTVDLVNNDYYQQEEQ